MSIGEKCSCPAGTSFNEERNAPHAQRVAVPICEAVPDGHCLTVAYHNNEGGEVVFKFVSGGVPYVLYTISFCWEYRRNNLLGICRCHSVPLFHYS